MPATCFGHNCGHSQGGLYAFVCSITILNQYQYLKWLCVFHFLNLRYLQNGCCRLGLESEPSYAGCLFYLTASFRHYMSTCLPFPLCAFDLKCALWFCGVLCVPSIDNNTNCYWRAYGHSFKCILYTAVFEIAYFHTRYVFNVSPMLQHVNLWKPTQTPNTNVGLCCPSEPIWAHGRMLILILELTVIQPRLTYFVNLNCIQNFSFTSQRTQSGPL
jgi:hypothetical protein